MGLERLVRRGGGRGAGRFGCPSGAAPGRVGRAGRLLAARAGLAGLSGARRPTPDLGRRRQLVAAGSGPRIAAIAPYRNASDSGALPVATLPGGPGAGAGVQFDIDRRPVRGTCRPPPTPSSAEAGNPIRGVRGARCLMVWLLDFPPPLGNRESRVLARVLERVVRSWARSGSRSRGLPRLQASP